MRISTAGVVRRNDTFLIALRKPGTSIGESWEFIGGKARAEESPAQALRREFGEELGVEVEIGLLLYQGEFANKKLNYHLMAFAVELLTEDFVLSEHQELRWATLDELNGLPMASSDRQILSFLTNTPTINLK